MFLKWWLLNDYDINCHFRLNLNSEEKTRYNLCNFHGHDSTSIIAITRVEKYQWLIIFIDFGHLTVRCFCLFGVYRPTQNFSLIWRRNYDWWRAANFDLCSALMAIEQWGFFNVRNLLRHGHTVYNGHLRGPVTLAHVAEPLAVELSLPVSAT